MIGKRTISVPLMEKAICAGGNNRQGSGEIVNEKIE